MLPAPNSESLERRNAGGDVIVSHSHHHTARVVHITICAIFFNCTY